jgi:hypothetical protein
VPQSVAVKWHEHMGMAAVFAYHKQDNGSKIYSRITCAVIMYHSGPSNSQTLACTAGLTTMILTHGSQLLAGSAGIPLGMRR